jgi:long-chain-acyl-CoA dehydrogenase
MPDIPGLRFDLGEDIAMLRDAVQAFAQAEIAPRAAEIDRTDQFPMDLWRKLGELGVHGLTVSGDYGGTDLGYLAHIVAMEEISRASASVGLSYGAHSNLCINQIHRNGTAEQKAKYLPKMATGELVGAIAMTEPGTGSDLQAVKTTAVLDGDHYVLNGSKIFITNGYLSDLVIVVAKTGTSGEGSKDTSLLLVEAASEGFSKGKPLNKVGMKAQDTCELFFNNVRVPKENLLGGKEGMGFIQLMTELAWERLIIAITSVAGAEHALKHTIDYTKQRKAFGKPIGAFQNTRFKLAEMKAELAIARVYVDRCIELVLKKKLGVDDAATAKYWTSDLMCKVIDECVQLHGGYGYMLEYPIARAWVDARAQRIYGGTNEIMKELIARTI